MSLHDLILGRPPMTRCKLLVTSPRSSFEFESNLCVCSVNITVSVVSGTKIRVKLVVDTRLGSRLMDWEISSSSFSKVEQLGAHQDHHHGQAPHPLPPGGLPAPQDLDVLISKLSEIGTEVKGPFQGGLSKIREGNRRTGR
jgi:hypothetical protein